MGHFNQKVLAFRLGDYVAPPQGLPYLHLENVMRGLDYEDRGVAPEFKIPQLIAAAQERAHAQERTAKILAIGCGAGRIVFDIQKACPAVNLVAINKESIEVDPLTFFRFTHYEPFLGAPLTLEEVEKFLPEFHRNVLLHDVDQGLPFENESFDFALVGSQTLHYLRNEMRAIDEIKRVLRPNAVGRLCHAARSYCGKELSELCGDHPDRYATASNSLIIMNTAPGISFTEDVESI